MEIWRERNQATVVYFPLIDRGTLDFESTPVTFVAADTQFSVDGAAFGNTTNTPVHEGNGIYSLTLVAAEVNGQSTSITVIDAATKLWEDQAIIISTYGDASAEHAVNLNDPVRAGLTALPNAVADGAGGLPISDLGGLDLDTQLANTNEITVARMGALTDWIDGGRLDLILDIIAVDTTTDIPALIAALNDLSTADVLGEVNTALDTAISELTQTQPATTPSLRTGLMLLYMALRNRTDTQTSGTDALEIYNNAGTMIARKLLSDDGSDYSEALMIAGI